MTRFLGVLVIIIAIVACIGLYLGWFKLGSETTDGKTHVTLTVDQNKIKETENKVVDQVHNVGDKIRGKSSTTTTTTTTNEPAKN